MISAYWVVDDSPPIIIIFFRWCGESKWGPGLECWLCLSWGDVGRRRTSGVLSFNIFEFYLCLEFSKIYEIFSWFVMTIGKLWTPLIYYYCIKDCVEFIMRLLRRFEIDFHLWSCWRLSFGCVGRHVYEWQVVILQATRVWGVTFGIRARLEFCIL